MEISLKRCSNCNLLLPFSDFTEDKRSKDGYKAVCDICLDRIAQEQAEEERRTNLLNQYIARYKDVRLYCKTCMQFKTIEDYYISVKKNNTVFKLCKECHKERDRVKREKDQEKRLKRIKKLGY